ncbi:MAG: DUF861 domain-containing protein [Candidatus Rokubacteria bacterium]|nr:DUF861 domain-containing protein [Candidatus Rokubacteria bacterium]
MRVSLRSAAWSMVAVLGMSSVVWANPPDSECPPAAAAASAMLVYEIGTPVAQCQLTDLGDPANLGGQVLEGDVKIAARVDFAQGGMLAGVFQSTRGRVLIYFPFNEHATIITGKVTLTDETGQTKTYHAGESYFIRQGSVILWEVSGPLVQKSFFNFTTP